MGFDFAKHRQESLELFRIQRPVYEQFAEAVRAVLRASIPVACPIHSIEARAKGLDQFADKSCKVADGTDNVPKYAAPLKQITDLAGVRVITFFPRNIEDVCKSIEAEFDIKERRDKGEELVAENRFGYQSIHYLIKMRDTRTALTEYRRFDSFVAEIQVRTILQHAWAEMEHDIQYKSAAAIPSMIRRRFMSLAGMFEIADREFQAIQDADADLRKEVRIPLDEELIASDELKVDSLPPDRQLEKLEAEAPPETRQYLRGSARVLLLSGYYAEAVRAYDEIINQHPRIHTNYLGRARARFLSGDSSGALSDLIAAGDIFPADPEIGRLRAQIEEGAVASPQEKAIAQSEALEGNRLLAGGMAEQALERYLKAEEHGWSFVFCQFNKAITACLMQDYEQMEEHLSRLRVRRGTAFGIAEVAIRAVAAVLSEKPQESLVRDLKAQLEMFPTFSFARSHLRFFEEGLAKRDAVASQRAEPIFALLRGLPPAANATESDEPKTIP